MNATVGYSEKGGMSVAAGYTFGDANSAGLGIGVSYSKEQGFGGSISVPVTKAFNLGLSYTQKGGFGVNAGLKTDYGTANLGVQLDNRGGFEGFNADFTGSQRGADKFGASQTVGFGYNKDTGYGITSRTSITYGSDWRNMDASSATTSTYSFDKSGRFTGSTTDTKLSGSYNETRAGERKRKEEAAKVASLREQGLTDDEIRTELEREAAQRRNEMNMMEKAGDMIAGAWLSMNNTLGQWGRDVAGMVSDFGESLGNWFTGNGLNTNKEMAVNAAMKELGRQEAVAAALGAYEEFSKNYDVAVKGAMGEYDKMQAAYGAAAKEYDKMNEAINKAVNFINRDINVSHEEMKRLTESLNQGPNAGLEKEIEKAIKMFSQNKGLDADEIRRTACVAASLYADLQIAGANVEGSFAEFFANNVNNGNIRGKDAFITEDKQKNIVGQYEIGGNKAELQIIRDYDAFENLINSNDIRSGIVRITNYQNLNFSHNINIYNHDDDVYVSDVGTVRNHGKTYDEIIRRKNFEKFMFIKY